METNFADYTGHIHLRHGGCGFYHLLCDSEVMDMTKHKMKVLYAAGNEGDGFDVFITFTHKKGAPAQGPSYSSGGQPADPPEIEFVSVEPCEHGLLNPVYAQPYLDDWARGWLEGDGFEEACTYAYEENAAAWEEAQEMRRG